jgi:predicted MFS family arabinose efflux permease
MKTVEREKGQLRLGLHYVAANPVLRNVILAVAVVGTFAYNFTVTLPLLTRHTFHQTSAAGYGILMAAMGLGAIFGGLFIAHRSRPTPRLLAILTLGFGFFMTLTSFSPSITWAEIALVPTGAFSLAFVATANATLQLNSSQQMRGRVMSLFAIAFLGTTPIGAPLIGVIVAATNARIGLEVGSGVALLTGLWLLLSLHRDERNTEQLQTA